MRTILISGRLANGVGHIIISISGPEHHSMNYTFVNDFELPQAVIEGDYYIAVSAITTGEFTLDITGDCRNLMPEMPFKFRDQRQTFYVNVL